MTIPCSPYLDLPKRTEAECIMVDCRFSVAELQELEDVLNSSIRLMDRALARHPTVSLDNLQALRDYRHALHIRLNDLIAEATQ